RVERFKHDVDAKWEWPKAPKALMTELLLRGPQTLGELRTRASRLYAFENLEAVSAVVDWLSAQTPPWLTVLPRAVGQSAVRYGHTLYPPDEAPDAGPPAAAAPVRAAERSLATATSDGSVLQSQIEAIQSEMADLHEQIASLRRRLDTLEGRM
ncbi:MAG: DUF480 domain-containing protein, partial [Planctomycetes bacterium]|nr:DUF480 domain-containing protein [Planctomycetota bacterium]